MFYRVILNLFICFIGFNCFSQISRTHYIPPISAADAIQDQWIYISTPNKDLSKYTIKLPDGTIFNQGEVSNTSPAIISLGSGVNSFFNLNRNLNGQVLTNSGLIIHSQAETYASVRVNSSSSFQAGAIVSKGDAALGKKFYSGSFKHNNNAHFSFVSIMATEDETSVTITIPNGKTTENNQSGTFSIILEQYQSYLISSNGTNNDLIGTYLESSKPIVVNSGSTSGSFGDSNGQDYGMDQLVGLERVGNQYILVRGDGQDEIENVLIIAAQDDTNIYLNGNTTNPITLNKGNYTILEGDKYDSNRGSIFINTSNSEDKLFVFQGVGRNYGGNAPSANQGMFFVPPLSCSNRGDVDNIPSINNIGNKEFTGGVTFVTRVGASILVNGEDINNLTGVEKNNVLGNNYYMTYKVKDLTGNISVVGNSELYVAYYNYSGAATSGGFYSGFTRPPDLQINLGLNQLGSCINQDGSTNVSLEASNYGNFDSVVWEVLENSSFVSTGNTSDTFVPQNPGTYRLKGIVDCTNTEYVSNEVIVSICPDDNDKDGIIDNIDLDLDNDGIKNSFESNGDGKFNFTDPLNPVIELINGMSNTITIQGEIIKSNEDSQTISSSSTPNGSFESQINEGLNQVLEYKLSFNEEISLSIKDDPDISTAIKEEESFIIQAVPGTKNFTLLNDDNNLLVDTNGDGIFEKDVSLFTGPEIKFKINPDYSGDYTYEFLASEINGLIFKHNYNGTTGESVLVQSYYLKDFKLDTDGDGIYDFMDTDSDGDGCNDVIEAGFEYEGFVGDPDSDGKIGISSPYQDGDVDNRGLFVGHNYELEPKKNTNGNYLFQIIGKPTIIQSQPLSQAACEGSTIEFNVNATSQDGELKYQWQLSTDDGENWSDLIESENIIGVNTEKLTILSISSSMNGNYRVLVNSEFYLCETISDGNVTLTVNLAPENPTGQVIQTFCQSDTPTISDLSIDNLGSNTLYWYLSEDAADPLDPNTELEHNKFYYAEVVDLQGCISNSRFESKAFISNPTLSSTKDSICLGDSVTLTIENIAKTAADFASENDLIFISNNGDPVTWNTEYGKTYFMIQANTGKAGFSPIDWPVAKDLTDNYNSGDSNASARMYVIKSAEMEKTVHDGLVSMGLTGNNGIAFWLGLYQDLDDPDYQEPGNESQNWGGWKWVDGTYLKNSNHINWWTNEPNNAGGAEHHGQFEFSNNGIKWNDMSVGNTGGQSWPLFEYTGSTDIVWGYYDENGDEIDFEDQPGTGTLNVNPDKTTTYFVKVTVNGVICYATTTITLNPDPSIFEIPDYIFCDDESDGDANNGSITLNEDDFTVLNSSILGDDQELDDFSITYFLSLNEAENNINSIEFPFTSPSKEESKSHWENISTEIFVRVENLNTGCISYDKAFNLVVNPLPITFEVDDIILCDDDYDGIVNGFDLESRTEELRSGNNETDPNDIDNQSSNNFVVTYHLTIDDANDLNKSGLSSPFESESRTIYYRIQQFSNDGEAICFKSGEAFDLVVNPLPIVKTEFVNIEQCDDGKGDENDGITLHNLTESQSLFSDNYENEIFEYYTDISLDENFKIEDPTAYSNVAFNDTLYLKIITENGCEMISKTPDGADRLVINITVGASEISENFIEENNTIYSVCEDSDAESQDGFSVFSSEVLIEVYNKLINSNPKFDDQRIKVSLHTNSEDGLTGENPIDINSNFTTVTPNTQEIWARVVNADITEFTCLGYEQVATLYVEPRPIANAVTIDRQCDGDNPDDLDSQDGKYPFDVSLIESKVILDQTDVSVSYFNEDGTEIQNFGQSLFLTESQTITIIVEKEPSYPNITNPDGLCYDETTLEFIVDDSPEAYPVIIAPHCDGDDGGIDNDGYDTFDTSEVINTILTNPDTGIIQDIAKLEIEFTFVDENGNTITDSQLPNPFITDTQTVTFTVENPLNTNCIITDEIEFVVNPLPEFTVDDDTIVCLNLPVIPIGVTSAEAEYTYSWVHEDINGNSSPFPSTEDTIFIGVGGTYYVTATTTDGTNCSRTLSINVEESIIATIALNDITVKDLTNDNNNTITIDPTNLGIGDYEYAIDDPSGPYQDEPFFEQVRPGIHIIYVRDKNNCGVAQIDVSVIGYKKFFTPNNDGIHDTWRILGIREDFQPNSKVYIFDRYGKLLKELDPLGEGWDGTFIGRPMPQSDYWFIVFLEDGREFKGHFSLVRGFD